MHHLSLSLTIRAIDEGGHEYGSLALRSMVLYCGPAGRLCSSTPAARERGVMKDKDSTYFLELN